MRWSNMPRFVAAVLLLSPTAWAATYPDPVEGDYSLNDFRLATGETLPELRLHYTTIGSPSGDAVLIMHGTGGGGKGFLSQNFAGELFGPGQVLDASRAWRRCYRGSRREAR